MASEVVADRKRRIVDKKSVESTLKRMEIRELVQELKDLILWLKLDRKLTSDPE